MLSCFKSSLCQIQLNIFRKNIDLISTSMMATENISELKDRRVPYKTRDEVLLEKDIVKEPFKLFDNWFEQANNTPGIIEANAMFLATSTKDGFPSGRMVLLKSFGKNGFVFFTNYKSRKGEEMESNPKASLAFYWEPLKRSVRIEGDVVKTSEKESNDYFQSRPYASKLGAIASEQSKPCESRDQIMKITEDIKQKYKETDFLPKPEYWGGYVVVPKRIEFWQGQSDRLHDRIVFRKIDSDEKLSNYTHQGEDGWYYERLFP